MDNFQGQSRITIQKYAYQMSYNFEFTVCTSISANDGYLPHGTNIASIDVIIKDKDNNEISDILSPASSVSNNIVTVSLNYKKSESKNLLSLIIRYTLDNGSKDEADFARIYME